ncbi:hypothetical protein HYDPIDRAFT_139136 [Hydnomerulius pinastri MD-312]|uniref:VHS domain-containing protein n=1 Tax=Hydnomerulius pinastri MD-312 TaxID=994086 RepID=A0A0C9V4L1_9AGAM|nr:hypothetical protein HYDPIDRAFT_139136 [Hydnomerulius pinastri MD-312]
MKLQKFFGRDKPKPAKVTPLGRDIEAPGQAIIDEDAISAHHGSFQTAAVLQSPPSQPREQPRIIGRVSTEEHWEVVATVPGEDGIHIPSPRAHQQQFPPPVIPSRSSSLGSLPPPGASPQIPSAGPTIMPRSSSPFSISSNTNSVQGPPRGQRSERDVLRKKSPPTPAGGVAALGILKALEPHQDHAPVQLQSEISEDYHTYTESVRTEKEKKEKKGFWDGMLKDRDKDKWKVDKERDREKERERLRDRDRREDDPGNAELTRMIGYLTATASEDWSIVLEVCERASANESSAKEAAKALRREFKYAEPKAQLAAARLWAIMLRNASDVFLNQISQRKFIDALEDVLTSSRTSPVVRERLMEVLAAAAFITSSRAQLGGKDKDKEGFRALWCRLKPADKPESGVPFDTDDAMFSPPVASLPRPLSQYSLETPTFAQQTFARDQLAPTPPPIERTPTGQLQTRRRRQQQRVIPLDEDIRRLFQECEFARGNAELLSGTLAFAKPDALDSDLIPEFLAKCRASQELIYTQIPWATAGAERSRDERIYSNGRTRSSTHGSLQDPLFANMEDAPAEPTVEEKLLAALLDANEALLSALRMYDDLARIAVEKATEEKSRRETKMDRRQLEDDYIAEPPGAFTGSSRAPSPPLPSPPLPSPPASPHQQFDMPSVVPSQNHPLPRIPPSLMPSTPSLTQLTSHHYHSQANTPTLLAPPHPLGPRSPAQILISSRTPSPDRIPTRPSRHSSLDSGKEQISDGMEQMNLEDDPSNSEDEINTPMRPSAKALGKRRVVEEPDEYESSNMFFGNNKEDPYNHDSAVDSDSDDGGLIPKRQATHYVYDAAAERTAQHLREGRVSVLVNGVH